MSQTPPAGGRPAAPATAVLVHGSWHGPWCWEKVQALLDARGIPSVAPKLPSMGNDRDARGDLRDDARVVRDAVDAVDGPVVLVGHSYAGAVITEASAGAANVAHLVYLCALVPGEDECIFDCLTLVDEPPLVGPGQGLVIYDDEFAHGPEAGTEAATFYHDCDPADVAAAIPRLVKQNAVTGTQVPRGFGFREHPVTYVVCSEDRTIHPALQRFLAQRLGGAVVEWPTSHSPILSRPDLVADLVAGLAGA